MTTLTLTGTNANDTLSGGAGSQTLIGGLGADLMVGGLGNDTYEVDNLRDVVSESSTDLNEIDTVRVIAPLLAYSLAALANIENLSYEGSGNTRLTGNKSANVITASTGNDTLDGGLGADTLVGGGGDDTYFVENIGDLLQEAESQGRDKVFSTLTTYTLTSHVEDLTLMAKAITGVGNNLANTIVGNTLANTLVGGEGADTLDGGKGADTLVGGAGDDVYLVDTYVLRRGQLFSFDWVDESENGGVDRVESSVTYVLPDHVENLTLLGRANINATGNSLANQLLGNSGRNILDGQGGDDTLEGGAGNDTYIAYTANENIIELASSGVDTVRSKVDFSLASLDHVENATLLDDNETAVYLTGNSLGNVLTGNRWNNYLSGMNGNDTINGGVGDDLLDGGIGADRLIGGAGNDTYVVDNALDVITEAKGAGSDVVEISRNSLLQAYSIAKFAGVEHLLYEGFLDINLTGNALNNSVVSSSGDDTLDGGGGADTLIGGAGDDVYVVDTYKYISQRSVVNGQRVTTQVLIKDQVQEEADKGNDTIRSSSISLDLNNYLHVENIELMGKAKLTATGDSSANMLTGNLAANLLQGGGGNDTLIGGAGNDTLDGGTGVDTLEGGTGNDTYVVDNVNDVIVELTISPKEIDTVLASVTMTSLGLNLENLILTGSSNIDGTGNSLNNTITGNAGINVLDGGEGIDVMLGGAGNDTYIVDNVRDLVIETINAKSRVDAGGTDTVKSSENYTLPNFVENLTLTGTANLVGNGNALGNVITGNTGANILFGGAGADTLDGANGSDIYLISLASEHLAGEVIADTGNGVGDVDEIRFASTTAGTLVLQDSITGIERVVIGTGAGSTAVTAGKVALGVDAAAVTGALEMLGNAGNNALIGTVGADTIDGGLGSDRLTGGAGVDHFKFSSALGAANIDTITDFAVGQDKLVLDSRIFTAFAGAQSVSASNLKAGQAGVQATEAGEFLVFDTESKKLYYDSNGSGAGGLLQFATFATDGDLNLSASDFLII